MTPDRFFLIPLVLGHFSLFVFLTNVIHALGHPEYFLDRVKMASLAVFTALSALIAWEAWNGPILAWSWPSLVYGLVCLVTGLVVFPATTTSILQRRVPVGIKERETLIDFEPIHGRPALIGDGKYSWLLKAPGNQSFRLRKLECEVELADLPRALDGLSVVHISDLHFSPSYGRQYFESVFDEVSSLEADLVLFTGDLVDHDTSIDWVEPLFSRIRGRLGSYAILGNHDLEHHPDRLGRALADAGFVDLEGRWATVDDRGSTIALGGTSYPWGPPLTLADKPRADFRVLLSHAPDQFYWAERAGFNLMLSGHNHGGQIRFPLVGPVFMPSVYSRRFDRGFFRKGGLTLHVSQGVGAKHPIRYGCLPEIGRLVLRDVDLPHVRAAHDHASRPHGQGITVTGETNR